LEKASAIEDVLAVKAHMAECLKNVRDETKLRAAQVRRLASSLEETADDAPPHRPGADAGPAGEPDDGHDESQDFPPDRLTGLPGRRAALQYLSAALRRGQPQFVFALHIKQLAAVNNRYGNDIGDALLLAACARLQPVLGDGDRLFRWSGNSLVAALDRPGDLGPAASEINRAIPKHAKESFPFKSRSLMLALGVESTGLRIADFWRTDDIEAAIDQFLGIQLALPAEGIEDREAVCADTQRLRREASEIEKGERNP
jgi:GGDEF domain-containing protein